ncbi:MAG: flagellar export chaperone FliS [Trichloromonas sp.]|jgi:flagellar protein FliS|nr:flagellar export chaperone FliS [Trichloromonas sp.]
MSAAYMNQYFENQVNTASPEQLLIMLYNGAIRFVGEAEEAMASKKIAYRGERISKSIAILSELSATLDHEIGGEIAANLAALYDYMIRTLLAANIHDDAGKLAEVREMLSGMRDTWLDAIDKVRAEQAAEASESAAKKYEAAPAGYRPLAVAL